MDIFNDIRIINDSEIKNIISITIKCCCSDDFTEIQKLLKLGKKRSIHFEDFKEVLNLE